MVFYALALGIGLGLLAVPVAEIWALHRLDLRLVIPCVVAGAIVLYSIAPRPDRFDPPGPALEAEAQPELHAELRRIAAAMRQKMPRDIYLVPDVNAWVAERGGMLGLGRRRVMGLGLPLLQLLTVPQLRAVLAHEFGHFSAGDTRLGPWIHRTRGAIVRTVIGLAQQGSPLRHIFIWYCPRCSCASRTPCRAARSSQPMRLPPDSPAPQPWRVVCAPSMPRPRRTPLSGARKSVQWSPRACGRRS